MFKPLRRLERTYINDFNIKMGEYDRHKLDYDIALKSYKGGKSDTGTPPDEPTREYCKRVFVNDATPEAIAKVLRGNPKGVTLKRDELSGILFDLDRYTNGRGGGFKTRLLEALDGEPWVIDRAGEGKNIEIPKAWLGISGTIQPGILARAFEKGDIDNGFLPRFILIRAIPDKPHHLPKQAFSKGSKGVLQHLANVLSLLEPLPDNDEGVTWDDDIVQLSTEAYALYEQWHDNQADSIWVEHGRESDEAAALMKSVAKVLSCCLLMTLAEASLNGTLNTSGQGTPCAPVTADQMSRAIRLGEWLQAHHRACMCAYRGQETRKEPPLLGAVRKVIVARWGDIQEAGAVSNSDLSEWVNQELGAKVSGDKIGMAATSLGLKSCKMRRNNVSVRGRLVAVDDVIRLQAGIKPTTVPETYGVDTVDTLKNEVSRPKPLTDKAVDTVDTVDTIFSGRKNNEGGDFCDDIPDNVETIEESPANNQFDGLLAPDCALPDTVPDPITTS
jgi:hypothetical protein